MTSNEYYNLKLIEFDIYKIIEASPASSLGYMSNDALGYILPCVSHPPIYINHVCEGPLPDSILH